MSGLLCLTVTPWAVGGDWEIGDQHIMGLKVMEEEMNVVEDWFHLLNNFALNQP